MALFYRHLRLRLHEAGLLPASKVAQIVWYLLGLDLLLYALQKVFGLFQLSYGDSLGGWVSFLSFLVIVLFSILAFRWIKAKALWRLRNRLIVTYVFIGVIPVVMLITLALLSFYLFAGQFATFIVTTSLTTELKSLQATNSAITHQFASQIQRGAGTSTAAIESLRQTDKSWARRQICVWLDKKLILNSTPGGSTAQPPTIPSHLKSPFGGVVRDQSQLFVRAVETTPVSGEALTVLSSEPFDQQMLQDLAADLGQVALYATGLSLQKIDQSQTKSGVRIGDASSQNMIGVSKPEGEYLLDVGNGRPPTYIAGTVPPPAASVDRQVTFPTTVLVVNWDTGDTFNPAAIIVQTRVSKLYDRLFGALGDFAPTVEFVLLFVAIIFGIIELIALVISYWLTRTVTGAVAQLYEGTQHVNRGDFSHRIPVKSNDQVATLANSFNSMTASLEKLIEEQKDKQRLENELVIAKEVQAQLFPQESVQLASLEVHGFFRPARTVSGDYYDFLALDADRLILAVGDVSGKGISAALLMATIHAAVRALSLQDVPVLREPAAVGAASWARCHARLGIARRRRVSRRFALPAESSALRKHARRKVCDVVPGDLQRRRAQAHLQQRRPPAAHHHERGRLHSPPGMRRHRGRLV